MSAVAGSSGAMLRDRDDGLMRLLLIACGLFMLIALLLPVAMILTRSLQDADGAFVGLANYRRYFGTGAPWQSMRNSLFVSGATTAIVVTLAFAYAYALTRTRMRWRGFFRVMAMVPLLSPSLLKAIGLVYWFGNQGLLKSVLMGESVYGPIGIILSCVLWTFPHAVIILRTALALADARVYEAATALRTSAAPMWRLAWAWPARSSAASHSSSARRKEISDPSWSWRLAWTMPRWSRACDCRPRLPVASWLATRSRSMRMASSKAPRSRSLSAQRASTASASAWRPSSVWMAAASA